MSKQPTRYFNTIHTSASSVIKTSTQKNKLIDEINWFQSIPQELKKYIPTILDQSKEEPYIEMENCGEDFGTLLCNDKKVNWELYFGKILNCMKEMHSIKKDNSLVKQHQTIMYKSKTLDRILDYNEKFSMFNKDFKSNGKLLPGLGHLLNNLDSLTKDLVTDEYTLIHGDFFLGNILQHNDDIKLIDPRGSFGGRRGIYGDPRYDWAKMYHDICYDYSNIVHGKVKLVSDVDYITFVSVEQVNNERLMLEMFNVNCPYDKKTMDMMVALLFVSMIPLHSDDYERQKLLLISGLEAYSNAIS